MRNAVTSTAGNLRIELGVAIGVGVVAVVATTILTFGVSLLGADEAEDATDAGIAAVLIDDAAGEIEGEITGSELFTNILTAATRIFGGRPELRATALTALSMLSVAIVSGDATSPAADDINASAAGPFTAGSTTTSVGKIARKYGKTSQEVRDAIHRIKAADGLLRAVGGEK
jgi:hypothetical protein